MIYVYICRCAGAGLVVGVGVGVGVGLGVGVCVLLARHVCCSGWYNANLCYTQYMLNVCSNSG